MKFSPKPKPQRISDKKEVLYVKYKRDGCCMIGLARSGRYGWCSGELDVHHITHRGAGGDDVGSNMITLCRKHHDMAHRHLIAVRVLKEIVARYDNGTRVR